MEIPEWVEALQKRIESDGCTVVPDVAIHCCVLHDYHYRISVSVMDKMRADRDLMRCIWKYGDGRAWYVKTFYVTTGIVYGIGTAVLGWFSWVRKRKTYPPPQDWIPPEVRATWTKED